MSDNLLDQLISDCEDPTSYPTRLRYTHLWPHTLRRYEELLNEQAPRIFSNQSDHWKIRFWDSHHDEPDLAFSARDCTSLQEIQNYLWCGGREDPLCRHAFIEANHSLAPLNCSREILTSLFSFHQVMPQFLDIVLSFGALRGRSVSTAVHRCIFQYEHLAGFEATKRFRIPQLGRSGWEIRHCYNLWSAERSDHGKYPWTIRQAGLYHSFDVQTGKATWFHVKTNSIIRKRIKEATISGKYPKVEDREIIPSSFMATLVTHLIVFEWCNEGWDRYLSHWECELAEILAKVQEAPVRKAVEVLRKANPDNANNSRQVPQRVLSHRLGHQQIQSNLTSTALTAAPTVADHMPQIPKRVSSVGEMDALKILNGFNFDNLQRLYFLRTKFLEADMILELNTNILTEIGGFYHNYVGDRNTYDITIENCRAPLSSFTQRTRNIVAELQRERIRIATLISLLENGKSMLDTIMSVKNMELRRISIKRVESLTEEMHQSTL